MITYHFTPIAIKAVIARVRNWHLDGDERLFLENYAARLSERIDPEIRPDDSYRGATTYTVRPDHVARAFDATLTDEERVTISDLARADLAFARDEHELSFATCRRIVKAAVGIAREQKSDVINQWVMLRAIVGALHPFPEEQAR
jgi:hypothetical protein